MADLRVPAQGHAAAGEHPHPYGRHRARDRDRLHRRHGARHHHRGRALVVGPPLSGARSLSRGGECDAEDRIRADLLHLARRHALDLRHVACDLAVHHHPDDLQRLPGRRPEQDQARADLRGQQGADPDQGRAAGQRADADRGVEGECRPVARGRRGGRVPVRERRPWLPHPVRQPDLQDEHRDDRDHHPRAGVVGDVPRDLLAGSRGDATSLAPVPPVGRGKAQRSVSFDSNIYVDYVTRMG